MPENIPPEADALEQALPASGEDTDGSDVRLGLEVPESDALEQAQPASPQPATAGLPTFSRTPREFIPEADQYEQALAADRDTLDDDR